MLLHLTTRYDNFNFLAELAKKLRENVIRDVISQLEIRIILLLLRPLVRLNIFFLVALVAVDGTLEVVSIALEVHEEILRAQDVWRRLKITGCGTHGLGDVGVS